MLGHQDLQQLHLGLELLVLGVGVVHVASVVLLDLRADGGQVRSGQVRSDGGQVKSWQVKSGQVRWHHSHGQTT